MARPREFDETAVLDKAMFVFWQRGFAGASISDLEEATGMKRQSLYNAFGDKEQLYARTLTHYGQQAQVLFLPLKKPGAGLKELRAVLRSMAQSQRENDCRLCMIVKTAFDHQVNDPKINQAVNEAAAQTRNIYARVLTAARDSGEISNEAEPQELARYLFTVSTGLSALAQTGASPEEVDRALDFAMQSVALVPPTHQRLKPRPTQESCAKTSRS